MGHTTTFKFSASVIKLFWSEKTDISDIASYLLIQMNR